MLDVLTIKFYLLSKPVTPVEMTIMVSAGSLVAIAIYGCLLSDGNSGLSYRLATLDMRKNSLRPTNT